MGSTEKQGGGTVDDATPLFHLVPKTSWPSVAEDNVYFPATYAQDGFIHATADPAMLLNVANHFYRDTPGEWLCLEMTVASVTGTGVNVLFEPAAPVGQTVPTVPGVAHDQLFPHIFGGLEPRAVTAVHEVQRDDDGHFVAIGDLTS